MVFQQIIVDIDMKQQKHCISPQKYLPSTKTQEITRFNSTSFGKGDRLKFDTSRIINIYLNKK